MSSIAESAVIWQLKQSSAVTAIVGQKIYPRIAPQDIKIPYLIVLRPPGQMNDHTSQGQVGVARTPIVVACAGSSYDESRSLGIPVHQALDGTGWTGSKIWNGTEIASCMTGEDFDQSGFPQLGDEIGFPVEFMSFELEHST
jgi:hypothetical protein